MGKKINVVNLNGFEATAPTEEQPTNEVDEMSKIKEEVKNNEPPVPLEAEPTEPPPTDPPPKPKRKPPSAGKNKEVKEEIILPPTQPTPEEVEVTQPDKKIKTVELVSCPDCKKDMSKKTLRYSHEKNCTGKPVVREEVPVKRRAPVKTSKPKEVIEQYVSIPEEIIQQELNKRVKEQKEARIRAKDERIKKAGYEYCLNIF